LGDAGRLTEVFANLLNNAIDAMPEGGNLTLRASSTLGPESGCASRSSFSKAKLRFSALSALRAAGQVLLWPWR
jgi:signal transduction histidine kinase